MTPTQPRRLTAGMISELTLAALVVLGIFAVAGHFATHSAAASETSVELKNSVEDLPATTVKVLGFVVPADGVVSLELLVHRGPAIAVQLTSRGSAAAGLKANEFRLFPEFSSENITTYRKSGVLPRGEYFLNLSNSAPDPASVTKVRVFARFSSAPSEKSRNQDK